MSPIITTLTSGGAFGRRGGASAYLYDFTTATFTPGGNFGRTGPNITEARSGITAASGTDWTNDTDFFNIVNDPQGYEGVMQWTVPEDATYRFTVAGGKGGRSGNSSGVGGQGAVLRVDCPFDKGTIISMVVGQKGGRGVNGRGGGGGGGSFVWTSTVGGSGLVIAAGGGGGSDDGGTSGNNCRSDFRPTNVTTAATNNGQAGTTNGQGTGAGWLSDATVSTNPGSRFRGGNCVNFQNENTDPDGGNQTGGWGGWGCAGGDQDDGGCGGGFTGGNGNVRGAGGSYFAGLTADGANAYSSIYAGLVSNGQWVSNNNGDGYITIEKLV